PDTLRLPDSTSMLPATAKRAALTTGDGDTTCTAKQATYAEQSGSGHAASANLQPVGQRAIDREITAVVEFAGDGSGSTRIAVCTAAEASLTVIDAILIDVLTVQSPTTAISASSLTPRALPPIQLEPAAQFPETVSPNVRSGTTMTDRKRA